MPTRAEIISAWNAPASPLMAAALAEVPPAAPPAAAEPAATGPYEPAPYHADPDETVKCPTCEKMNDIDATWCDQCGTKLAGNAAVTVEPEPVAAAAPPPPPAAAPAVPDAPPAAPEKPVEPAKPETPTGDQADASVGQAITAIKSAVAQATEAQGKDPDKSDPIDQKVTDLLTTLSTTVDELEKTQGIDTDTTAKPAVPAAPAAPIPAAPAAAAATTESFATPAPVAAPANTPGNAEGVPGDADDSGPAPGDVDPTMQCQNPLCGHLASSHDDTADGQNQGSCAMNGCACPGMVPDATVISQPGPDNGGAPVGIPDAAVGQAMADVPGEPVLTAPPVQGPEPALPALDPMPNIAMGPAFTIPVGLIEGAPTGDGRMVQEGATTWRTPPLPLMWMSTSPHDPSGMSPNDPAFLAGRIDAIERDGTILKATGFFLATKEGMKAAEELQQMGRYGVSADIGSAVVQDTIDPTMPPTVDIFDAPILQLLVSGELLGWTGCPAAAFAGCYIVLGDGSNIPDASLPAAPPEAKMASMVYHDVAELAACVPCGDGPLVAAAPAGPTGPLAPPSGWFENPQFTVGDPRIHETIDPKTGRPSGKFACKITVTDDGQVFGHIAQWGVCHQNPQFISRGECVLAPRSRHDYAAFHGTGDVLTAEGELIGVGRMTADTGHANLSPTYSYAQAAAHYENSGLTTALVRAGEDEFGIWVAGSLHPAATPEQVFTMRSNPPSGDWRQWGGSKELNSVLFVNLPGFPMVKATRSVTTGRELSLVAAGVPIFDMPAARVAVLTDAERLSQIEAGLGPVFALAAADADRRMKAMHGG